MKYSNKGGKLFHVVHPWKQLYLPTGYHVVTVKISTRKYLYKILKQNNIKAKKTPNVYIS